MTPEAENLMVLLANEFIKDVTEGSCKVASLRNTEEGSDQTVEVSDLALYLKKNWGMNVEGYAISTTNSDLTKEAAV
ncbi:uncharacterized protein [Blastocystis hominis]|uniref:Transcription initiation factor TFIID subunit 12 domain-containing protein n=1 Tax=Blastocystis hominis TaxID=12968 RepID=D8LX03_BLAHO|nr:uncharacterized protein [Blastocystis hominis]CBK20798.2 unnamed protein product [Blastocystis hominis]|eukprot:XP_012894846.1 uncharacterized protein [Blastocystis hominis]